MILARDIEAISDQIARESLPQRIILFGSYAYGTPNEDSDVDFMVIRRFRGSTVGAACRIRATIDAKFPMDILVHSPADIRRRLKWGDVFILDVVEEGIVLYDATNSGMGEQGRRRLRRRLHSATHAKARSI